MYTRTIYINICDKLAYGWQSKIEERKNKKSANLHQKHDLSSAQLGKK